MTDESSKNLAAFRAITHWDRDKMAVIFQTTFSNTFSWMKTFEFRFKVHWILFLMVQLTIFQLWFRQWLGADQATTHYLNQWWSILLTHIRVTGPQWINGCDALYKLRDIFMVHTLHCNHRRHSMNSSTELRDRGTTQLQPRNVHAWVVTEWPLNHSPESFKGRPRKTPQLRRLCGKSSWIPHLTKCKWGNLILEISTLWLAWLMLMNWA